MKTRYQCSDQIKQARQQIRQSVRKARRSISEPQQRLFASSASQRLLQQVQTRGARHVALYLTNDGELDTAPLIQALWDAGVNLYLPRLHPFCRGNLLFFAYTPETTLVENVLKIREPILDITRMILPHELDAVVTPLVAFDNTGARMGMGGGFYDRTLANWHKTGKPYPIGFAHDCQQVDSLDSEHWDVPLPVIVTPTRVLKF
ncbi:5-formyltetrahydrofolate cyclo-ligase [uncultured Shewanella sp.]|uniref:5-formyltetrahydrofolate cyclo-ligase n=1 Tax=Shewanella atlantica TaxID=271099 RepID=UPI00262DBD8C|nr:5-formyltetrahydrofolate cyclo-ligase [uncultured Shewanella sp.]